VINPSHLEFRQPVSHCSTIGELILARGVLLKEERKKKRGKRANIGVFNYGKFVAINTLSIHQAGIGSPEDEQLVNMSFKSHAAVSLYQSELYL